MTPRFAANQNKARLIGVFLSIVVLALVFQFYRGRLHDSNAALASQTAKPALDPSLFIGIRHASGKEIRTALPEGIGRPILMEFSSRLCHDCRRLDPVVSNLMPRYPNIYFRKIDVLDDHGKAPAIFRTFKPVSVPVLVFIGKDGEIRNVLYNYQSPETVAGALNQLQSANASSTTKPSIPASSKAPRKKP